MVGRYRHMGGDIDIWWGDIDIWWGDIDIWGEI